MSIMIGIDDATTSTSPVEAAIDLRSTATVSAHR